MSLSEYEKILYAYYLEKAAPDFKMVPRFWPYAELVMLIEDKVQLIARKHGPKARKASGVVARAFVDTMIEHGAFSHVKNEFGGTMHQYQDIIFGDCVKQLRDQNPIIAQARIAGEFFWADSLKT